MMGAPAASGSSQRLAPPGAGLPFPENLLVRFYVGPFVAGRSSWARNVEAFEKVNRSILKMVDGRDDAAMIVPRLVPRLRGIEDSSRFWSVAQTLEHLVIVGRGIRLVVEALGRGGDPGIRVDIAAFKPAGRYDGPESVRAFSDFHRDTLDFLRGFDAPVLTKTHRHPWFGDFNTLQWQWLLAGHSAIHAPQIRMILQQAESRS